MTTKYADIFVREHSPDIATVSTYDVDELGRQVGGYAPVPVPMTEAEQATMQAIAARATSAQEAVITEAQVDKLAGREPKRLVADLREPIAPTPKEITRV